MRIKKLAPTHVTGWYQVGWSLWRRDIAHWLLVSLMCLLLGFGGIFAPVLHWVLYGVLPILIASLFYMARKVAQGKDPSLEQLFFVLSLEEQRNQLLLLGAGLIGVMVLLSLITSLMEPRAVFNYSLTELAQLRQGIEIKNTFLQTFMIILLKMMTSLVIVLILLFAPALILFRKMPALLAVRASLRAVWVNKGAMLFFLFIQAVLTLFALLPLGLGLLILLPVTVNALYRAYTEIFTSNTTNP